MWRYLSITGLLFGPLDMTTTNTLDVSTATPMGILDDGLRVLVTPNPPVTRYVATTGSDAGNGKLELLCRCRA